MKQKLQAILINKIVNRKTMINERSSYTHEHNLLCKIIMGRKTQDPVDMKIVKLFEKEIIENLELVFLDIKLWSNKESYFQSH